MSSILRVLSRTRDESALVENFIKGRPSGTQRVYAGEVRTFLSFINRTVHHIKAKDLRSFIEKCRQSKLKPATLHRKVTIIRSFFAFLHREGELPDNPMRLVEVPPCPSVGNPHALTQDQVEAFFAAMNGVSVPAMRDRAIFLLMASTGLRISEVRGLLVKDVGEADEPNWKTLKVTGKGEKEREVHVRPEVWALILHYLQRRTESMDESSPLFAAVPRARPIKPLADDCRLSVSSIFGRFKRLAKKASLPKEASPLSLRHYFAREADSAGASVEAIRIAIGHSNLGTTQKYLQRVRKGINEAFSKGRLPHAYAGLGETKGIDTAAHRSIPLARGLGVRNPKD
jgi:site-specific recombinase XerD